MKTGAPGAEGWLVGPATNRFTIFRGDRLHGVLPAPNEAWRGNERRVTLLVGFWGPSPCSHAKDPRRGPCRVLSDRDEGWLSEFPLRRGEAEAHRAERVAPHFVPGVWAE